MVDYRNYSSVALRPPFPGGVKLLCIIGIVAGGLLSLSIPTGVITMVSLVFPRVRMASLSNPQRLLILASLMSVLGTWIGTACIFIASIMSLNRKRAGRVLMLIGAGLILGMFLMQYAVAAWFFWPRVDRIFRMYVTASPARNIGHVVGFLYATVFTTATLVVFTRQRVKSFFLGSSLEGGFSPLMNSAQISPFSPLPFAPSQEPRTPRT